MDLSEISGLFFAGFLFFIAGLCCFYIPFRNLKKKVARFIKDLFPEDFLTEEEEDIPARLSDFASRMKARMQSRSDQILFWQQKFSALASATKEATLVLNEKGQLIFHNPQTTDIFYFDEQKQEHYLNEITRSPDVMAVFRQSLKTNKPVTKECVFGKKNQYIKSNFLVKAVPVDGTKKKNVILLFYDQTDIKESQQAHIDFVSNVSHELKTPLTSLRGYVEMLLDDFRKKKFDQFETFLNTLLRNGKRMSDLVNDLLNLSHLASQVDMEKKQLNTKELTEKVIERIKLRGHRLHFSFSAPYVMANRRWVEIVLHNLVDNACRHTLEKCNVYIKWEKKEDRVVLKVTDSGEGIPEKYLHRVFERFFRVDPARSREKGGTGVGLALVKQSMEKHGGCVRARTLPSTGGTEFICEFPNS